MNITKHEGKYYKEVKRVAKAGERVKIVEPHRTERKYTNGDVLTCTRGFENTSILVKEFCYPCIGNSEYVVLEPLTVMADEPHPEIAEGSTFVVVDDDDGNHCYKMGENATLVNNDNSDAPRFMGDGKRQYVYWHCLSPLNIIYKDKPKQETVTIYGYDEFGMPVSEAVPVPGVSKNKFKSINPKPATCPSCGQPLPKKRIYTAEQIREARDIVYRIMTDYGSGFVINQNLAEHIITVKSCWSNRKETYLCPDNTEFNRDIGIMRAICKLTGEKLPKWILRDGE